MRRFLLAASIAVSIHVFLLGMEFEWLKRKFSYKPGPGVVTLTLAHRNPSKSESMSARIGPEILPREPVIIRKKPQHTRKVKTPEQLLKAQEPDKKLSEPDQKEILKVLPHITDALKPEQEEMPEEPYDSESDFVKQDMLEEMGVKEAGEMVSTPYVQGFREVRPIYRENPRPEYPRLARRRGYQGTVVLEVFVDRKGRVGDLKVFQSSGYPVLDRAAMTSVREWLFEPAIRGDERMETWVKIPIRFQLLTR